MANVWLAPQFTGTLPFGLIEPPAPAEAAIVYVFGDTMIVNGLLEPASPLAAVAVSVNGPYVPAVPHAGVQLITPVEVLNEAPLGSAGLTDQVTGPVAYAVIVTDGVMVSELSSTTVCGVAMAATDTGALSIVRLAGGPVWAGVMAP